LIRHASVAGDGNSKDSVVRKKILLKHGVDPSKIILGEQTHGINIAAVKSILPNLHPDTDGFMTDLPGVALGVFSADCAPVFLSSMDNKVIGILHAGRRGTAAGILPQALKQFRDKWGVDSQNTVLHLGPHIRKCCYEVDLTQRLLEQAAAHGIPEENRTSDARCTACGGGFFSYRRTKTAERMLSFILIK